MNAVRVQLKTDPKRIYLDRAKIGRIRLDSIDITVKSATGWAALLAPTWDMVNAYHKNHNTEAYIEQYQRILDENVPKVIENLMTKERWVFLCYCADHKFCHTHLVIDYLVEHYPDVFVDARSWKWTP